MVAVAKPQVVTINSPAKINWGLQVGRKLSCGQYAGYHTVLTLMQAISLADELTFRWPADPYKLGNKPPCQLTITGNTALASELPDDNLVSRAYGLFYQQLGTAPKPVCVTLNKLIPTQAGLGGGSSNAASVLTVLNQHHGQPFTTGQLEGMAATLGCDVPFFIQSKPAICSHIGEVVQPIQLDVQVTATPLQAIVVKLRNEHMPTGEAYQAMARGALPPEFGGIDPSLSLEALVDAFRHQNIAGMTDHAINHFYQPALKEIPSLKRLKTILMETKPLVSMLTGSGSAMAALYQPDVDVEKARQHIQLSLAEQHLPADVYSCKTVF